MPSLGDAFSGLPERRLDPVEEELLEAAVEPQGMRSVLPSVTSCPMGTNVVWTVVPPLPSGMTFVSSEM